MSDYLDNRASPINSITMTYSDSYMNAMFWGEVAALIIGVLVSVLVWTVLPTSSLLLLIPASLVTMLFSAKMLLAFVHIGYKPEDKATEQVP